MLLYSTVLVVWKEIGKSGRGCAKSIRGLLMIGDEDSMDNAKSGRARFLCLCWGGVRIL